MGKNGSTLHFPEYLENYQIQGFRNSAETVKVLWSHCQNEHSDTHTRHCMGMCEEKGGGQTKEKMDRQDQRRL